MITCSFCKGSILPGEQKCVCGANLEHILTCHELDHVDIKCDCGYYPVVIPKDSWEDCPECGKSYI